MAITDMVVVRHHFSTDSCGTTGFKHTCGGSVVTWFTVKHKLRVIGDHHTYE